MKRKVIPKKQAASAKTGRARPTRTKPARKRTPAVGRPHRTTAALSEQDFVDRLMAASAEALGLSIDPAWRGGVRFNLGLVLDHAARVEAFSLPDDVEPAPIFHA